MENELVNQLIQHMRQTMSDDMKLAWEALFQYDELERTSKETDAQGRLTKKAHSARARLANPFLLEESSKKTRRHIVKQKTKREKELAKTIVAFAQHYAVWNEYRARLEEIDRATELSPPVDKSRQSHDPESLFALGSPFIERLAGAGVSPSAMGRLPKAKVEYIADLIKAHSKDPHDKDPNSPWVLATNAGILEAPARNLNQHQLSAIAYAFAIRSNHQTDFIAKARRELNLPEGFSEDFLAGVARICDLSRQLTHGESEAYYEAFRLQLDHDIVLAGRILGLDTEADYARLATVVDLFRRARYWLDDDLQWSVRLHAVKTFIDRIEPHKKYKGDWTAELIEALPKLAELLSESVDSYEAFSLLLQYGLDLSEANKVFEERRARRKAEEQESQFEDELKQALLNGSAFKIEHPFVHSEGDWGFDQATGKLWTCEEWIEKHGLPDSLREARNDAPGDAEIDPDDVEFIDGPAPGMAGTGSDLNDHHGYPDTYLEAEFEPYDCGTQTGIGAYDQQGDNADSDAIISDDHDETHRHNASDPSDSDDAIRSGETESLPETVDKMAVRPIPPGSSAPAPTAPGSGKAVPEQDSSSPQVEGEFPPASRPRLTLFDINDEDMI